MQTDADEAAMPAVPKRLRTGVYTAPKCGWGFLGNREGGAGVLWSACGSSVAVQLLGVLRRVCGKSECRSALLFNSDDGF